MVRVGSLFNQILAEIPRDDFARLVERHGAERASKGFGCWTQLVAMLFCHLAHAQSLREICNGLSCFMGKLTHVGVERAPCRSTLSYANEHRPARVYEDLFWLLLDRFRRQGRLGRREQRFRFKNPLMSMDSTMVSLCLGLFPWSDYRNAKGGIKAHVLLDHADFMPRFVRITDARTSDITVAREAPLWPGSIVVMDRGYGDFKLYRQLDEAGVFFVARLNPKVRYEVIEERALPEHRPHILGDRIVCFTGPASSHYTKPLRLVEVWDEKNGQTLQLLTNHLAFGATTVAAIYQERWRIEVFFKTLKQHLKIKTFVGTSPNALRIQIWTALIALLLLRWLHHLSQERWSLSNLASLLRLNLFTYRDLHTWLNAPWNTPPLDPVPEQLALTLCVLDSPTPKTPRPQPPPAILHP